MDPSAPDSGFFLSVLSLCCCCLIVIAAGGGGFFLWRRNQKKPANVIDVSARPVGAPTPAEAPKRPAEVGTADNDALFMVPQYTPYRWPMAGRAEIAAPKSPVRIQVESTGAVARASLRAAQSTLDSFAAEPANAARIETVADVIASCFAAGNKVLICGNGGSMADAMHFAEELTGRDMPKTEAEVVAAALQDRNRAVIVGSRTYGKGSIQEPSTLSDGSAIELTVGTYLTPSGRKLDGVGIEPDVVVSSRAGSASAEQRALEVLRGLVAASDGSVRG